MNEIKVRMRTKEERESYVDGYSACFKRFKKYFEQGISFSDALNNMEMLKKEISYGIARKEE